MTDATPIPTPKPKRKPPWYWNVVIFVTLVWLVGGVNALFFQDTPVLVGVGLFCALLSLPVARWIGKPESRWVEPVWILFVGAMFVFVFPFALPPFAISPETTYITEPRLKDGYGIDYFAASEKLIEPGEPSEDNGARLLAESLGRPFFQDASGGDYADDAHWKNLCKYLNVDPDIGPKNGFLSYKKFLDSLTPEEKEILAPAGNAVSPPYSDAEKPIIERFLNPNAAAIDLFEEASRKPVFYIPMIRGDQILDSLLPGEQVLREMIRNLQIRCLYRIAVENKVGATSDLLAMHRLATLHRPRYCHAVSYCVDNAVFGVADGTTRTLIVHGNLTTDEMTSLKKELEPYRKPITDAEYHKVFLGERFSALDAMQGIFDGRITEISGDTTPETPRWKTRLTMRLFRTNQMLRYVNSAFDSINRDGVLVAAKKYDDFPRGLTVQKYAKEIFWYGANITLASKCTQKVFIALLFPALESLEASRQRREIIATLTDMAFELEKHRLVHQGSYPKALDEPGIDIPNDPYSATAFQYKKTESGYILYSFGPNRRDDEGKASSSPPCDDIAICVERNNEKK